MRVFILDKNFRKIDEWEGTISNGVFTYEVGGFNIPLMNKKLGAEKKTINMSYEDTIDVGKEKQGYMQFNGKDYIQLTLNELSSTKNLSIQDWISAYSLSKLQEEQMLKKPFSLFDIAQYLLIIAVIASVAIFYFATSNLIGVLQHTLQPFNLSIQQNAQLIKILINQTAKQDNIYNQTILRLGGG